MIVNDDVHLQPETPFDDPPKTRGEARARLRREAAAAASEEEPKQEVGIAPHTGRNRAAAASEEEPKQEVPEAKSSNHPELHSSSTMNQVADKPSEQDAEGDIVTVIWGEEKYSPIKFHTYDCGPYTIQGRVRAGETAFDAMTRMYAELRKFADSQRDIRAKAYWAEVEKNQVKEA